MASKKDAGVMELEPSAEAHPQAQDIADQPKLILTMGRGRIGKSTFVRWAAERSLTMGGLPVIADADRTNATLSAFFENVTSPPSPADDDVRQWLGELVERQIEERFTAFLDLGGGDQVLKVWSRELDLAPFLESYGITPVALHFLGCEIDDLSYLRDIEAVSGFRPKHTLLVLNEGMVPTGRTARTAFEPIVNHEVFRGAIARDAVVARMPRLVCMHEIETRRISFADAEDNRVKPGQAKIGPINKQLITRWRAEMEGSFAAVDPWIR
jgi:hypothetical protein